MPRPWPRVREPRSLLPILRPSARCCPTRSRSPWLALGRPTESADPLAGPGAARPARPAGRRLKGRLAAHRAARSRWWGGLQSSRSSRSSPTGRCRCRRLEPTGHFPCLRLEPAGRCRRLMPPTRRPASRSQSRRLASAMALPRGCPPRPPPHRCTDTRLSPRKVSLIRLNQNVFHGFCYDARADPIVAPGSPPSRWPRASSVDPPRRPPAPLSILSYFRHFTG
jgi:hypothetical protein